MPQAHTLPPLSALLAATVAAVEAEGERLLEEFHRPEGPRGSGSKAPIDNEIEERLREALRRALCCTFVGEESGLTPGAIEGWCWVVDPHDATSDFLKGHRGSAISVGLLRGAVPVLGVVQAPASPDRGSDTFAWAEGAGPLRRNGIAIAQDLRARSLVAGELAWTTTTSALRPVSFSRALFPARFVACASIAHRMARVAAGDGIVTFSTHEVNEYDIAAGAALIRASGGVVLDASGREVVFTGKLNAIVNGCFAGAPEAAARLARVDWSAVRREAKNEPRVLPGYPKVSRARGVSLARAQGCMLGQAIGDSLGSLVESMSAAEIARAYPGGLRELADGGTWNTIAGQPTDDTELALALARSIVAAGRYDAPGALAAYRAWLDSGPFSVGATTRAGLAGSPDGASEANGSLMRAAPIGVWAAGDPARAAGAARMDSALTHPGANCADACAAYAAAIATGVGGAGRAAMLQAALAHASRSQTRGRAGEVIERAAGGEPVREFERNQGWVLIALQNAFFRLMHAPGFEEALVTTVGAGGDTDTNAAIAGALLGAALGIEAIPPRWILPVLACRPLAEANVPRPRPSRYWPDDVLELAEALLQARPL